MVHGLPNPRTAPHARLGNLALVLDSTLQTRIQIPAQNVEQALSRLQADKVFVPSVEQGLTKILSNKFHVNFVQLGHIPLKWQGAQHAHYVRLERVSLERDSRFV
jgi:hypothetical protein